MAKNATESTDYGDTPVELDVDADEIGDVRFALLALAKAVALDADEALVDTNAKYESRFEEQDSPASQP